MKRVNKLLALSIGLLATPTVILAMPIDLPADVLQSIQLKPIAPSPSYPPVVLPFTADFCAEFPETKTKIEVRVVTQGNALAAYVDKLPEETENRRNERDARLEEARSEVDQLRGEQYARLMDRADGDDEEDAVEDYQKSVEDAVGSRRSAVDAAIVEFRKGTDLLLVKRRTAMESTWGSFRASMIAMLAVLETGCANGVATASLVSEFKGSLAAAQAKVLNDKKMAESTQGQMKKLADTQRQDVAIATKIFRAKLTAANAELKQAFGGE